MTETSDGRQKATGLVVRVAGSRWFVPLVGVVEVLRRPVIARVPAAAATILGLVNHRGRVLAVADPIRALELAGQGTEARDVVVVEARGRRFALGVEAVIELAHEARTGLATMDLERVADAVFGPPT
jgi:chemotaxis signal transduction protein